MLKYGSGRLRLIGQVVDLQSDRLGPGDLDRIDHPNNIAIFYRCRRFDKDRFFYLIRDLAANVVDLSLLKDLGKLIRQRIGLIHCARSFIIE